MTILTGLAVMALAQSATGVIDSESEPVEVAYEDLVAGNDRAALEAIEKAEAADASDPAVLINHGIALARTGQFEEARIRFEAAASRTGVELETANGDWVSSRRLARQALAMLDRGEFSRYYELSMR